jgi:hypothetical protein
MAPNTTKKKAWRPLKPGDIVETRAANPRRTGRIKQATVGADKHRWDIEFFNNGTIESFKSLQLQSPVEDAPATANPAAKNAHLLTATARPSRVATAVPLLIEETDASSSQETGDEANSDDEALATAASTLNLEDDTMEEDSDEEEDSEDEELMATPATPPATNDNSIEDLSSSDEEDEQEADPKPPEGYIMPTAGAAVDALGEPIEEDYHAHGEIDIEPENVHQAKWEQYKIDKAALLSEGWTITKALANDGISVGATVKTKARPQREGIVTGQTEDNDGKKHWLVNFLANTQNELEPEAMRPQRLALVAQSEAQAYIWTLVEDSEPELANPTPEEYIDGIGLVGFDFDAAFKDHSNKEYSYPYLKLLQKMWPGDWKQQQRQLNIKIAAENTSNSGNKNWRDINPVSQQEWWVFIGILISAGPQGKGGKKLWEKPQSREGNGITMPINYGPGGLDIMPHYRFKDIKRCFPWSFQDKSKAEEDPWNLVLLMVDGYNKNRRDWVAASVCKVLDESMSAFRPRTSKAGGLPHLSFILRKPEPLGTEFKVIACEATGKEPARGWYIIIMEDSF